MATTEPVIWVLLDDRAGNRSQALGVAERLGFGFREIELRYGPLGGLPNALAGASVMGLDGPSSRSLTAPWPDLVIAAGRRTAPVARWIKRQGGGVTRLVQIMDPGAGAAEFDLILRPAHDRGAAAANVLEMAAAPHRLSAAALDRARGDWGQRLARVASPRIAVIVGGSTRRKRFTDAMALDLMTRAQDAARALGGGLMVSTSRRTGAAVETVAATLAPEHLLYRWDSGDENPYLGYLAVADALIVTGESVSMLSEACATGLPVYIFAPPALIGAKHARLHRRLIDGGHARLFEGAVDPDWRPVRLDVAETAAGAVLALLRGS